MTREYTWGKIRLVLIPLSIVCQRLYRGLSPSNGTECVESFLRGPESGGGGWGRHCKWTGKCGVNFRRGRESEGTSFQIFWTIPLLEEYIYSTYIFMYYRHIFP